jgi:hypothetical protein
MKMKILIVALVLAVFLAAAGVALANGGMELPRRVLGGGASDCAAEGVALHATLGQPVVGVVSRGDVTLGQGFWGGATRGYSIYLPVVIRG